MLRGRVRTQILRFHILRTLRRKDIENAIQAIQREEHTTTCIDFHSESHVPTSQEGVPMKISDQLPTDRKPRILFLCTGNSCRSQMGEGLGRALKGDLFEFASCGVETHGLNPNAVRVMGELGIDITTHQSELVGKYLGWPDVVVSVCAHAAESCPVFPGKVVRVHRGFDDPPKLARELAALGATAEQQLEPYRQVRDQIRAFVLALPASLEEGWSL
jgi:arsenate reductase